MTTGLSEQVIAITQQYLGPTSERFIHRLISSHFNKPPHELTSKDMPQLAQWVKVSLGLLTDDKQLIDECERKLLKLVND